MKTEIIKDIRQGFETAYINGTLASNLEYNRCMNLRLIRYTTNKMTKGSFYVR